MTVVVNDVALDAIFYNPSGPLGRYLQNVYAPDVLAVSQKELSRPWPGGRGPFPAPGPPFERDGTLKNSMVIVMAVGPQSVEAAIVPTAVKRGWNYGLVLRDGRPTLKGPYRFMPEEFYL